MTIQQYKTAVEGILATQKVVTPSANEYGAHYTKSDTPRILLKSRASNHMRQYDGDYMNDPEEGRYLIDIMMDAAEACTHRHKRIFVESLRKLRNSKLLYSAYNRASFLSCWTVVEVKESDWRSADSLNHWRFYGENGKGACLMIPLAHLATKFPDGLYYVSYGSSLQGGGSASAARPIRRLYDALAQRLNTCRVSPGNAQADFQEVVEATHPLLFLFKSEDYSSEKEVRSIVHTNSYSKTEKVDLDDRAPRRAFIPSNDGLVSDGTFIHFGPKAEPELAIEALALADLISIKIKAHISTKRYR